ncbi:MAG: flavin reductase family protein [Candidatus Thermoplasmatota archaeon]
MNKKALHKISYGLYLVCSKKDDKINGQIANAIFQVTSENPTIAVSINKKNLTHEYIEQSKAFTVSILKKDTPLDFVRNFGFKCGRDTDKMKDISYKIGSTGAPIITDNSLAYIEAKLINKMRINTHTIFVGEVVNADIQSEDDPLTYDFYRKVKGGYTSKNAPTYIEKKRR